MWNTLRKVRTWYKVHKWVSIFTGLALLMWLVTSITMTWEQVIIHESTMEESQLDFRSLQIAPADAVSLLEAQLGHTIAVRSLVMRQILGTIAYEIGTEDNESYLIHAVSGKQFAITPERAEQIARAEFLTTAQVTHIERLDFNSIDYPFGPVPVYRVVFDDWQATYSHVSIAPHTRWGAGTGDVYRTDRWGRIRELLGALHTFDVLRVVTDKGRLITLLLWVAALLTLFAALVGYYLALPRRRRQAPQARQEV